MPTRLLFALVVLLLTPWVAEAAPDLTGKQLSLDWNDPKNEITGHVRPGVYRTTEIGVESGAPGAPIQARLLNPTEADVKFCGADASYVGTYSAAGTIEMRLTTPGHAANAPCTGKYLHELKLKIGRSGTVSGQWGMASGGWAWGEPKPISGRCVNCEVGDTNWTPAMIVAAIVALLAWLAYKGKQIEAAKRAVSAPAAAKPASLRDGRPSFDGLEETGMPGREAPRPPPLAKPNPPHPATPLKPAPLAKTPPPSEAQTRATLEAERERLKKRLAKAGRDLIAASTIPSDGASTRRS